MGPCSHDDVSTLFHESCVALRVASMLFEGGGRCPREAVSIRPPPGEGVLDLFGSRPSRPIRLDVV